MQHACIISHAGLLMLGCVILVTTNSRLIIENLLKYGLLYNPVAFIKAAVPPAGNLPLLCCWPALLVFAGVALAIEQLGALRVHVERKVGPEFRPAGPCRGPFS